MKLTDNEFKQLADFIKRYYGISLKEEKRTLIETRLSDMLIKRGIPSYSTLYSMLIEERNGDLRREVETRITTNYTYFMRETDTFSFFETTILPWIEKVCKDKSLRVWSAGCSSGEEAYNIAMIIADYFMHKDKLWDKQILATDISDKVLISAKLGIYSEDKIQTLPSHWKSMYLQKYDNMNFVFKDIIKKEIMFKKFNLMDPFFPYRKKFHTIFCRNVMIYFDENTRNEIIGKFVDNLEVGGFFLIGKTESIDKKMHNLEYIKPGIYRKKEVN